MNRRRALRIVSVAAVAGVLAGCTSSGAAFPEPATTSSSPAATSAPSAAPTPTLQPTPPAPSPAPTPRPTPTATPVSEPPKPTGATFREDAECLDADCYEARITQTVTWRAPRTEGLTIRVYGVTECLAEQADAKPGATGPCLVVHTRLPASVLTLLAEAPASAGRVSWSWVTETGCDIHPPNFASDPDGPMYFAIAVGSYNTAGLSVFAIAEPGEWRVPLPGEMPC